MSRYRSITYTILIGLVAVILIPSMTLQPNSLVWAFDSEENEHDDDGDHIDDDIEELNDRALQIEWDDFEVQIQSARQEGKVQDQLEYTLKIKETGLEILLQYQSQTEGNQFESQIKVQFPELKEYLDNDNNSYFSTGDTELRTINFDALNPFTYEILTEPNGTQSYHIQTMTSDTQIRFHLYVSGEFFPFTNSVLTPTQVKLDFEIEGFSQLNSSSRIALQVLLESEEDVEYSDITEDEIEGFGEDESKYSAGSGNGTGFFSWSDLAFVEQFIKNVTLSPIFLIEEGVSSFYFNYPGGSYIYHDPKLGIQGIYLKSGSTLPPTTTLPSFLDFISNFPWWVVLIGVILLSLGLIMSKTEYRQYLLNRVLQIETGPHRLSMEDVLENEIRIKILNFIIDQPGIHYKELLRLSDVSPSTLAWHLDILETYKVVHKQRVGHFLIYYPYLDKNPFIEFDPTITKSKFTLDIFQLVGDNPGIQQSHIANRMASNRKTVQYHLSKLEVANLIRSEKSGRILKYYAVLKEIPPAKNELEIHIEQ